jgi:hydroxypyruvate isomerase
MLYAGSGTLKAARSLMPRFSANLGFLWPERPLLDRIDAAARAGFRAIELHWPYDTPAQAVADACSQHDLTLLGLNTATGDARSGEFGLGALPGREGDFQRAFDQAAAYARAAGAKAVHVMAGVVPPEARAEAERTFAGNLKTAAEQAGDLTLLLEPINRRDKPGYFYSTTGEAAEIISRVGAANLRIMFDVYHVGISEGDVLTRLARHLPLIGHVQIAAVPSRAEPDEGEIAYRAIFDALDALGYDGWVGCEYKPRGDTDEGLRWLAELRVTL